MNPLLSHWTSYQERLEMIPPFRQDGKVTRIVGLVVEASLTTGSIGDLCEIQTPLGNRILAEIGGFNQENVILMPLQETVGLSIGSRVRKSTRPLSVPVGPELLGRVIDGLGNPIDGKGPLRTEKTAPVHNHPPNPLQRQRIRHILTTGIRAIDGLVTIGKGQRVGIFAGSGVGKSVLLGMMAKYTNADVNVIALIGERGREVRDFLERDLGPEGLKRSVVVVATSDQAPMVRVKGALLATTIAESFRSEHRDVLLLMDSLTRVAMAQREIGLAMGEPPTTKGYTPSVFALLPRLLERAGTDANGSISGLYTVLVEGDDLDEPVSDAARAILDGHIVLSRKIAQRGHYPAIDVLGSVSRLRTEIAPQDLLRRSSRFLELLAGYREAEDLINIGAYTKGSNPVVDEAIQRKAAIDAFLKQDMNEAASLEDTMERLEKVLK
ncbi:MAG: FliI/YscN family ATPase [Candidatus Neomarinimicrobiota bacterium]|nr:MAG: FliI/YscN family ATPase [Candidatus Neomarinimicrobiota bacterium]